MCEPQQKYEPHGRSLPGRLSGSELVCQKEVEDPALVERDALLYQHAALPDDHSVTVSKETLSPRFKHTTDWQQVPLHCISHNVFGVDLMAIENYILVVVLLSAVSKPCCAKIESKGRPGVAALSGGRRCPLCNVEVQ